MKDYYLLKGIPSNPYAEAMADLIAYRSLVGLGIHAEYQAKEKQENALAAFWFVCEIGSVALHEIRVWNWFYNHPNATVEELKDATIVIAKAIWNEYFAEIFGERDVPIFAIYNHFISGALYLHSYPLGNMVLRQLEAYFEGRDFADEMLRVCKIGTNAITQKEKEPRRSSLKNVEIQKVELKALPGTMVFIKKQFTVEAGKSVEIQFNNTDDMPHNLLVLKPNSLDIVDGLAD